MKLPRAQLEFIHRKIAAGTYPSADAVISEAINLLERQDQWAKDASEKIEAGWSHLHVRSTYLIVFDPASAPLQIVRVLHGARDVFARL